MLRRYYRWKGHRDLARGDVAKAVAAFLRARDFQGLIRVAEREDAMQMPLSAIEAFDQLGGHGLLIESGEKWLGSHRTTLARRAFELAGSSEGLARVAEEQLVNGEAELALTTFHMAGRRDRLVALADQYLCSYADPLAYRGFELAGCTERLSEFQVQRQKNQCPECGGQGVVPSSRPFSASGNSDIDQANTTDTCSMCGGGGYVIATTITYQGPRMADIDVNRTTPPCAAG